MQLATLEPAPAPRAHFRTELRTQLVAIAPRLVADGDGGSASSAPVAATPDDAPAPAARDRSRFGSTRRIRVGRALTAAACTVLVLAMLLGGAVWLSRDALPGDTLYGLKRASENLQAALAPDGVDRAKQKLDQAGTRYDEVDALIHRPTAMALGAGPQASGSVSPHTAALVTSTLGSADDDIRNAMQTLGGTAVHDRSAAPLQLVIGWAPDEVAQLHGIVDRIPAGSLHARGASSLHLLRAALTRAATLESELGCGCLSGGKSDALGPVPCSACSSPTVSPSGNPAPTRTQAPPSTPGRGHTSRSGPHHPTGGGTDHPSTNGSGRGPAGTGSSSGSGGSGHSSGPQPTPSQTLPTLPGLPTLPTLLPHPSRTHVRTPGDTGSCALTLGPIGIGLGSCGLVHVNG